MKRNPILNLFAHTWKYSEGNRHRVVIFIMLSVLANTALLADPINSTVADNITMDVSVSKDDLAKAIRLAQFENVVAHLSVGLETHVLEKGVSLSGGEKQRLALARGILAAQQSSVLLMDEPTSSVDTENELKIYQNIFSEFKNKTIISTVHRLHLLPLFDYVYCFDQGSIVADGTPDHILSLPQYRRWQSIGNEIQEKQSS